MSEGHSYSRKTLEICMQYARKSAGYMPDDMHEKTFIYANKIPDIKRPNLSACIRWSLLTSLYLLNQTNIPKRRYYKWKVSSLIFFFPKKSNFGGDIYPYRLLNIRLIRCFDNDEFKYWIS